MATVGDAVDLGDVVGIELAETGGTIEIKSESKEATPTKNTLYDGRCGRCAESAPLRFLHLLLLMTQAQSTIASAGQL